MARPSNCFFVVLNCLSFALGFVSVSRYAYIQLYGDTLCQRALEIPFLVMGLFLLVISLLGLVGSCCRANLLLGIYLFIMFVFILGLVGFTVYVLVVIYQCTGKRILQNRFADGRKWEEIKSCLVGAQVCKNLDDVDIKDWSPLQTGCCKPPMHCGSSPKNSTFWIKPAKVPAASDSDCTIFSNHQQQLCYDCNSCKREVVANLRQMWKLLLVLNNCVTVLVVILFSFGYFVRKKNRYDQYIRYRVDSH